MKRVRWAALAALACAVVACGKTVVDPNATAIEVVTQIDPNDGITQLQLSGTINGVPAFDPGLVPSMPRPLSGEQSADILLPESLDGSDVLVRVDALADATLVHTGGATVTVRAKEVHRVEVPLGAPAICGDGKIVSPFEMCDDGGALSGDGCSATCQVEPGWNCFGVPSMCARQSSKKEIVSFAFLAIANPSLSSNAMATINGTTISATVPHGTDVTTLVATFAMTGVVVRVAGATQISGATPNDFSSPVQYTVIADDGTTKTYTVMVTVAADDAKDMMTFRFLASDNPGLPADITATINGTGIAATVPSGTNVTALIANFDTTGVSVKVGAVAQLSDVTRNNFAAPVVYTVGAADSSTKTYTVTVTVAASSAKDIVSFGFTTVNNPTLGMDVAAAINGTSIAATVPYGTDVTSLVASFMSTGVTVKVGAVVQASGVTANNFTSVVTYTVTAADNSTVNYTVTVTVAPSTSKDITSFVFTDATNPAVGSDVIAAINGTTIAATVPFGTDVSALVATFATTGMTVKVAGVAQTSGITANNFTSAVAYTVTAADNSTKTYTVTVTIAPSSSKDITSFAFQSTDNPALGTDVTATINGTSIAATVPNGTDVTALVATFATTGATVKVGSVVQASGITANNFTTAVMYTVTAADNSTKTYTVTVTIAPSASKDITSFAFLGATNPALAVDVTATINGTAIVATVPYGTNVSALVATFTTTGQTVKVSGVMQSSGITTNNFTNAVTYTVTAADNSTKSYTVTVTVAPSMSKDITSFAFMAATNPALAVDVAATINGTTIAATVPFGTDVSALVATFSTTGASVTVGGVAQTSGLTANNFTNTVTYTAVAADSSTKTYTVTVTIAPSSSKDITSFAFLSTDNPGLGADVTATINGTSIAATVPNGTNVTALVAAFATTGATVKVGSVVQASGITANNFTTTVTYTVTAANSSTQTYTVTVTVAPSSSKDITSFAFLGATNPALAVDVVATINGTSITATVPHGTNVTALVATFATSGAIVKVGTAVQASGITANDFTTAVTYTVTAADSSTKTYTVTVTIAPSMSKDITSFAFLGATNPALADDITATINGTAIAATVPFGTDVTHLVATFATTGATVKVAAAVQTSGITANDFTSAVTYTVIAADNSTQTYTVTVTIAPSSSKDITSFAFLSTDNPALGTDVTATINSTSVAATVPFGTDVTTLIPTFATSGMTVTVSGVVQASGVTANDFTNTVTYTVTAADSSTKTYTVTVAIAPSSAKDITSFAFTDATNPALGSDVIASINGTSIAATVPYGTDVTKLVATFATSGASVTVGSVVQTSGVTANDFTNRVAYMVTAADASMKTFSVTVTVAPSMSKDLTSFAFLSTDNLGLGADVIATINGTSIAATVPFGTDVTKLVAAFATSGASVTVGGMTQTSGTTANDFTGSVTYTVIAADNSTKAYTVTVTIAPSSANSITSFAFLSATNPALAVDVTATISGANISATVPFGTDVTNLVATFATSGASVAVSGVVQASGVTANDFTSPVAYTVKAANGATQTYTVTVTIAPSTAKDITSFAFLTVNNPGLPSDVVATISGTTITATVPAGTNVTALVATFATTGATVTVGGVVQTSDMTANDFTSAVTYDVTAADSSTKSYTVTVTAM
jgi:cysteine-rich repeat protein